MATLAALTTQLRTLARDLPTSNNSPWEKRPKESMTAPIRTIDYKIPLSSQTPFGGPPMARIGHKRASLSMTQARVLSRQLRARQWHSGIRVLHRLLL